MRGLPVAMAHELLGLIVCIFRISEAWKGELYGVRGSIRVIKIIMFIFWGYLFIAVL